MDTFALIIVLGVGITIGIYIASQISEHIDSRKRYKEFIKNMNAWDNGRSKNDPVSVWNKHKRTKKWDKEKGKTK